MANRIVLYKHADVDELADGWQLLLSGLSRFVPGTKMESIERVDHLERILSSQKPGVLIVPLKGTSHARINRLQLELKKQMPYPFFFAIVFLLIEESNTSHSAEVVDKQWIHTLDDFYDQAIPVQLLYCAGSDADAHTFNIAASLSSLLRQLQSLEELRRLNDAVSDLESQIKNIQLGISKS